jgi:hypothetical protein
MLGEERFRLDHPRRITRAAALLLAIAATGLAVANAPARGRAKSPPRPPVVVENQRKYPTAAWEPLEPNGPAHAIEGYSSQVSLVPGQTLELHVSTRPARRYQVQIFRMGFYKGQGGRLVACIPGPRCSTRTIAGRQRELSGPDPGTGMVRETWPVSSRFRIPKNWVSGYYMAKLVLAEGGQWPKLGHSAVVPFFVRQAPSAKPSKILVISSVATDQAYNNWGGKSLYDFNSIDGRANHVSFDRPYATSLLFFEQKLLMFLEKQKTLDLSYATDVDVQRDPGSLLRHRLVIVSGHNEYWSKQMRDAYENARDHGVNLAFFGGNIGDWQIRWADNNRTIVEYKSSALDPDQNQAEKTDRFMLLKPPRPQCQLLGTQFLDTVGGTTVGSFRINSSALSDPWFKGTGFKAGDTFKASSYEYDVAQPGCEPYPTKTLFTATVDSRLAPAVKYVAPSGATVFGLGSYALTKDGLDDKRAARLALNAVTGMSK